MNLYVGNLSYGLEEPKLEEVFAEFGEVESVKIIRNRETDRSRGFGFVEMPNREEAEKAVDHLNGATVDDRKMIVNEARPRKRFNNNRGGGGGRRF